MPDHDVGYHGVTQRVHAVRDHSLQQLAQLEERGGDGGANLAAENNIGLGYTITELQQNLDESSFSGL